jgi:hypothetical protein
VTIAYDADSASATSSSGGINPITWTHTPVDIPAGVVILVQIENSGAVVTGLTYGAGTPVEDSLSDFVGGELGTQRQYVFFLGSGVPSGPQTVTVTLNAAAAVGVNCRALTVTSSASADTTIHAHTATDLGIIANPSLTVTTISKDSVIVGMLNSGQDTAAAVTVDANTTLLGNIVDVGATQHCFGRRTNKSSTNAAFGFTQTADEALMYGVAIAELPVTRLGTAAIVNPAAVHQAANW